MHSKEVVPIKQMIPIGVLSDGTAQTIRAQYYKNGYVNFCEKDGRYGATGVLEIYEDNRPNKHDQ